MSITTRSAKVEALTSGDFEYKPRTVKTLFFDIETTALKMRAWTPWKTNAIAVDEDSYMLSFSAKWAGGRHITRALCDYPGYDPASRDDKALVTELAALLAEADIIIGHNGDKFDLKKTMTRIIINGLPPIPAAKTVDTLKVARKHFAFTYNSLKGVCEALGIGTKAETGGFATWQGCERGDPAAWRKMKRYNRHDVVLLEELYYRLRPFMGVHPNWNVFAGTEHNCPACGHTDRTRRGFRTTARGRYIRYQCNSCLHYFQGRHERTASVS